MGENAQKIGKKLEKFGVKLFEMFNWNKKMGDKEIKCTRGSHKNAQGRKKQTHGIDLYMEYEDPYIGGIQGIFIECKNRGWNDINKSNIETWVNEEINLIECARYNTDLQEFYGEGADRNCALLLINCNDGKFKKDKFDEYLSEINVKNKRNPYKIFIAGNYMIDRWDAIGRIIREEYQSNLKILYPSINNSRPMSVNYWSINQLFSKYIFCEYEQEVSLGRNVGTKIEKILVIFFFDKVNAESFKYMWSMCRAFQYETQYQGFDICFWTETSNENNYIIENFIDILKSYKGKDTISEDVIDTIRINFLLNRNLNAVDN